jgi:hypothetical protein
MNSLILILIALIVIGLCVYSTNRNDNSGPIKTILRGSSRYALASLQDRSPMIALLHANYGAGYFWAMRDAYKTTDIENVVDILEYEKRITEIQDDATKEVMKICPQFSQNLDIRLAKIANEID